MRLNWYPIILAYHRVSSTPDPGTPTVTPHAFERQVAFIARHFHVLTLREAVDEWLATARWPQHSVVITFDDGDETTYHAAWPILRRHRARATVFMIAGNVDQPRSMTRAQLESLANGGIEIGSHTMRHAFLPSLSEPQALEELRQSKVLLTALCRRPIVTLSYPGGGFSAAIQRLAQQAGYLAACTTNRSLDGHASSLDQWALRRIKMTERSNPPLLIRVKLSGYYDSFRRQTPAC